MITSENNQFLINSKKVWKTPTMVLIGTDSVNKGIQSTHEAVLMPTHINGGIHYSKSGNQISPLAHYHS